MSLMMSSIYITSNNRQSRHVCSHSAYQTPRAFCCGQTMLRKIMASSILVHGNAAANTNLSDMTNHIGIGRHQSSFTWLQTDADKRWLLRTLDALGAHSTTSCHRKPAVRAGYDVPGTAAPCSTAFRLLPTANVPDVGSIQVGHGCASTKQGVQVMLHWETSQGY